MIGSTIISGNTAGSPTLDWDVAQVGDYNGDGYADIMLRNHNTGQLYVNMYHGTQIISSNPAGSPTPDWHLIGA
jgi:hypothetical protein